MFSANKYENANEKNMYNLVASYNNISSATSENLSSDMCAVWSESLGTFRIVKDVSSCNQRRFWSDCADAQADLSLC